MTHTPSIAFRHLPPRGKNAINHCLEFGHGARSVSVSVEYVLQHSGIWHKRGGREEGSGGGGGGGGGAQWFSGPFHGAGSAETEWAPLMLLLSTFPSEAVASITVSVAISYGSVTLTELRSYANREAGLDSHSLSHFSTVPDKPYGFCGCKAP